LQHISEVIQAVGKQELLPDVIGLGEVENRKVLDFLITKTDISSLGYSIVHFDSPDKRGIDVALLYRKDRFKPIKSHNYPVIFPGDMDKPTRDILYVKGELPNKSTLHVLVNHWPSRSGGQKETEAKRIMAAQTAKRLCDSISFNDPNANILIMGDLNDYPSDKSLTEALQTQNDTAFANAKLYNLMGWQKGENVGSHPYKGEWGFLDQIIVSGSIVKGNNNIKTYFNQAKAFRPDFLIEKNEKFNNFNSTVLFFIRIYLLVIAYLLDFSRKYQV
jgi:predicted extracellular nuclease